MKKIFSLVVLFAAVAMVGCCGKNSKKAAEAEAAAAQTECCAEKAEENAECCCEKAECENCEKAECCGEAAAEAPVEAAAETAAE